MKVGFSLKDIVFRENDREQLVTYETLDTLLVDLKKFGVNSIEIRKLVRQLDNDESEKLNQSVQKIWDLGMEITVHGDLTGDIKGSKFEEVYPSMKYILENFRRYQEKLVVTLHALQEKRVEATRNPEQLKNDTIDMLKDWTQMVESEDLPVYFALENNRKKEKSVDPGNSCEVVVEMVEAVDNPHLGICWDMGHLYSNLTFGTELNLEGLEALPPKAFLDRVYHTHIHSLNSAGRTHFPLTSRYDIPVEKYVSELKERNYSGVYNLELSFERFEEGTPVVEDVKTSISKLKNL